MQNIDLLFDPVAPAALSLFHLVVCSFLDRLSFYPIRPSVVLVLCVLLFSWSTLLLFSFFFPTRCLIYCMSLLLRTLVADWLVYGLNLNIWLADLPANEVPPFIVNYQPLMT